MTSGSSGSPTTQGSFYSPPDDGGQPSGSASPVAQWLGRAVLFLIAVPVAWIAIGALAGFAYLGNPALEAYWRSPLGLLAQGLGALVGATWAAARLTNLGSTATGTRPTRRWEFTRGQVYRVRYRKYGAVGPQELVGPYYERAATGAHMFWQTTSEGYSTHAYVSDRDIVSADLAFMPSRTATGSEPPDVAVGDRDCGRVGEGDVADIPDFSSPPPGARAITTEDVQEEVLDVLQFELNVSDASADGDLRHDYGLADDEVEELLEAVLARWDVRGTAVIGRPSSSLGDLRSVSDVVAYVATVVGAPPPPRRASRSEGRERFGPQTPAVFEVLREARSLPLHAGDRFERRHWKMADTVRAQLRSAMAEAMWAARRGGRVKAVMDARQMADEAASTSVLDVHYDSHSLAAFRQAEGAASFAIFAVTAAATRDLISEDAFDCLTRQWRKVVDS